MNPDPRGKTQESADRRFRSRRAFLQGGGLAGIGLQLPQLLAAQSGRGDVSKSRSCILLYATGGPAQQETFDPKPEANDGYRGEFQPIATSVPGMQICELLPLMARQADKYAIIRSTFHGSNTHGVGVHYNLSGLKHAPRSQGEPQNSRLDPPSISGVMRQLRGDRNGLPGAIHLPVRIGDQNNRQWAGQGAGLLGTSYDPLMLIEEAWQPGEMPPGFLPPADVTLDRHRQRANLLHGLNGQAATESTAVHGYNRYREQALSILESKSAWEAFLLKDESPRMLDRYGHNKFGRSCLIARRLVEAGVSLVTVPWMHLHSTRNFDTHANHFTVMKDLLMPPVDQAFSALLEDLSERGLLDETLVVWTGEFGRTPRINKGAGRDHWGNVYSTVLAGGGIRGGQAYGSSDKVGGEPVDNPVHVRDLFATIYHALGFNHETKVFDPIGRPHFFMEGSVVEALV
ncbi:MAG: DUF1501 domain-containing protein [Planctomycetaceae bacterium]